MSTENVLLDARFIRERQLALGLSQRELANRIGTSVTVLRTLDDGRNHQELSVGLLNRLAAALDTGITDLFLCPRVDAQPTGDPNAAAVDAASGAERRRHPVTPDAWKLLAALIETKKIVRVMTLASTFDWDEARTRRGLKEADRTLSGTGLEMRYSNGGVALRPRGGDMSQAVRRRLAKALLDDDGMRLSEARILRDAIRGDVDGEWEKRCRPVDRTELYRLLNRQLVERHAGRFVVHPDVAYSLGLAD